MRHPCTPCDESWRAGRSYRHANHAEPHQPGRHRHRARSLHWTTRGRSMIARTWTGAVRTSDADEYAAYIRDTGFAEYGRTAGNRGAWLLRRDENGTTEFITLSLW